jgi:hypothetical protein
MNFDKEHAERLTERILANPSSPHIGVFANDLLEEFGQGYPLVSL